MKTEVVRCKHCDEIIIECTWEEWTEFRNSKEAFIEDHESKCEENTYNKPLTDYLKNDIDNH